ncbi:MAG: TetR/AcrR family transcriptional regulator [Alphaproteobacteria bacterium]|nr:MAG: TetR/AcrR family transcriptional regulator [Alphaproteobacteria bacterium]
MATAGAGGAVRKEGSTKSGKDPEKTARPGRPRRADLDDRFLEAALDLLAERGYDGVSLEEVARRAASTRPSIYRRWKGRDALLLDAVRLVFRRMDETAAAAPPAESVRERIRRLLEGAIRDLRDPRRRRIMANVIAAIHRHPELDELQRLVHARRGVLLRRILEQGVKRGELPADLDIEAALDLLMGPVFYRCLVLDLPLDPDEAGRITEQALAARRTEDEETREKTR